MVQTVQDITRIAKLGNRYTSTTIDVIFTNCYSNFLSCTVLQERIGDHQALKCQLEFKVEKPPKYQKRIIRDHCTKNIDSLKEFLISGCDYTPILECKDVESAAIGLNDHINRYYKQFCPLKSITVPKISIPLRNS